ncbi:hypothetical protein PHMEG_00010957 [Phytophthora megakarya]|uniref:Uncharacterized protein n=1 Tax=Phytophthora megakarya TaxID=4795 RepID=A0A225WCD9_9STRA|nr:hypothetical protein PHMEG_00010957 [Phytophthora megakarya]
MGTRDTKENINKFDGPQTSNTFKGQGAKWKFPLRMNLSLSRRTCAVKKSTGLMIQYMKDYQPLQKPQYTKKKAVDLHDTHG